MVKKDAYRFIPLSKSRACRVQTPLSVFHDRGKWRGWHTSHTILSNGISPRKEPNVIKFACYAGREFNSRGGRLLREAWHTGSNSCNRCIELHPAYRVLRYRLSNRGRPNRSPSGTRTRREERTTAGYDQTPQDQRPTTVVLSNAPSRVSQTR